MIIKTNVVLDEVNQNGRLYTKNVFEKALDKYLKGHAVIYGDSNSAEKGDMMNIVGTIDGYDVIHNKVVINGKFLGGQVGQMNEMMYKNQSMSVTSAGYGKIDEDGVVRNFQLKGFYMIPSENEHPS